MNAKTLGIKKVNKEKLSSFIISSLKQIINKYDSQAIILLFESRARGDYHDESDWDFLILTSFSEDQIALKESIRKEILYGIEFRTSEHIAAIFQNQKVWEEDHRVTNLFMSIQEEGIVV